MNTTQRKPLASVSFIRAAHPSRDIPGTGYVYLHHFGTGHQELVFPTHEAAQTFAEREGARYSK